MGKKLKRGEYVSRSTYQKVVEENRRLIKDILILTKDETIPSAEKIFTIQKWRKKVESNQKLSKALKLFSQEFLKEHPEYDFSNRIPAKRDSNPKAFK